MRTFLWPTILITVLWLCMVAVLPAWVPAQYVPNIVLAGLLVLAITDTELKFYPVACLVGIFMDVQTGLLFGSFALGYGLVYIGSRAAFKRFVPADRALVFLPLAVVLAKLFLGTWLFFIGFFAGSLGFAIVPHYATQNISAYVITAVVEAGLALVIYVLWLETMHRFSRPLRMRA